MSDEEGEWVRDEEGSGWVNPTTIRDTCHHHLHQCLAAVLQFPGPFLQLTNQRHSQRSHDQDQGSPAQICVCICE